MLICLLLLLLNTFIQNRNVQKLCQLLSLKYSILLFWFYFVKTQVLVRNILNFLFELCLLIHNFSQQISIFCGRYAIFVLDMQFFALFTKQSHVLLVTLQTFSKSVSGLPQKSADLLQKMAYPLQKTACPLNITQLKHRLKHMLGTSPP